MLGGLPTKTIVRRIQLGAIGAVLFIIIGGFAIGLHEALIIIPVFGIISTVITASAGLGIYDFIMKAQNRAPDPRTLAIEAFAKQNNFEFEEAPNPNRARELYASLNMFPLFSKDQKPVYLSELNEEQEARLTGIMRALRTLPMSNVVRGTFDGYRFAMFDYHERRSREHRRDIVRQTVLVMQADHLELPAFNLFPESNSGFTRWLQGIGQGDIDLDAYPEFSQTFHLAGEDEARVRGLFEAGSAHFLENNSASYAACNIEGYGDQVLMYRHRYRVPPEELLDFLKKGTELADQLAK